MAFQSNGPVMLALPPFRGVTRKIILAAIASFFFILVVGAFSRTAGGWLATHLLLVPALVVHGWIWQLATYAFWPTGLLSVLFALLSVWFFASPMEDQLGSRWLLEFFWVTTLGGGLLASLLAWASGGRAFGITPFASTAGMWPFVMALLLAFARFNPDLEITLMFLLRLKAKYLAAIYLLFYLGSVLVGGDRFGALTAVCAALAGFLYLRLVPRRGLGFAATEQWFGWRNAFYRNKRRRAAKKFEVYMRDQGRDVHFDASGRYESPDDERREGRTTRDPHDRRWMN